MENQFLKHDITTTLEDFPQLTSENSLSSEESGLIIMECYHLVSSPLC